MIRCGSQGFKGITNGVDRKGLGGIIGSSISGGDLDISQQEQVAIKRKEKILSTCKKTCGENNEAGVNEKTVNGSNLHESLHDGESHRRIFSSYDPQIAIKDMTLSFRVVKGKLLRMEFHWKQPTTGSLKT